MGQCIAVKGFFCVRSGDGKPTYLKRVCKPFVIDWHVSKKTRMFLAKKKDLIYFHSYATEEFSITNENGMTSATVYLGQLLRRESSRCSVPGKFANKAVTTYAGSQEHAHHDVRICVVSILITSPWSNTLLLAFEHCRRNEEL